ncbi:ABC transporter F family member 4 [Porphyridium purpureum]|uniref:Probable ATP-dependent transporter ycf16 n=1 Tax=Porphyridium purpureum TaxID=35688 RepID=A0A5J4Z751_PORPP|nr:ABC transporter F family member 4 [Porphyridium purpureum]|eukprot:POR3902..scf295_1
MGEGDEKKKKKKSGGGDDWIKAEKAKLKAMEAALEGDGAGASGKGTGKVKGKSKEKTATAAPAAASSSSAKSTAGSHTSGAGLSTKGDKTQQKQAAAQPSAKSKTSGTGATQTSTPAAGKKASVKLKKAAAGAAEDKEDDYLAGLDLPSDDEFDYGRHGDGEDDDGKEVDQKKLAKRAAIDDKEARKKASREAEAMARAMQQKQEAMMEDEFVYDVSFAADKMQTSNENARDIKVADLTIRVAGKMLFDNTELTIAHGRRYALIGPNGHGKTTIMRLLGSRKIPVPENIDLLLVEQEMDGTNLTALEAVLKADLELMRLQDLQHELEQLSVDDPEQADARAEELNEVYDRLKALDASTAEPRAARILAGLGFTPEIQRRQTNMFSGGWRMRISLARALFIEPTLLLLDEPTNHLDLRAVLWLEEYLRKWKETLVVVSHDRDFLNSVVTDVIHVHDHRLDFYRGDFEMFYTMMEQRRQVANKQADKYEKSVKAAKAKGDKAAQEKALQKAKIDAKKSGAKDVDLRSAPTRWKDYSVNFSFPEPTELTPPLLQLIDVCFSYPSREDFGMRDINLGVDMGTRVAVVGPNGAGKSTLMNLLAGDLVPTAGESRRPQKLRIGRYSQHFVDVLEYDVNPVEYLLTNFPQAGLNGQQMRAVLGRFGLPGANHLQPIVKLSGGQKARVVFSAISLSQPHILLLDEPTNNLDMESIDALAEALVAFPGGVVLISHDSRIISRVCEDETMSEVWIVDNGTVQRHNGTFEDYKQELIAEVIAEQAEEQ